MHENMVVECYEFVRRFIARDNMAKQTDDFEQMIMMN